MLHLLQRNYPDGSLLEVYDRKDRRAPAPTPQAFAEYLAALDPSEWERVRCLTGHSVNFAIPVLTDPFRVFTIIRDPVERVVSLYHYLKGRGGYGEQGGLAGQLIRTEGWSIIDIYRKFADAVPKEAGEHQLFSGFFNGQTRTVLAPHFPIDRVALTEGRPESPAGLAQTLDRVLSDHYLLGSAARYGASVTRFAAEFEWGDTTVMRDNVTQDRPELSDLPGELIETIRAYNTLDHELHQRALAELADVPDPPPAPVNRNGPAPATGNGGRRPSPDGGRELRMLTAQLKQREQALARTEQTRRELDAKVQRQQSELSRQRQDVHRIQAALDSERAEHSQLRGASAARDRRLQELADQLNERDQELAQALQANQQLYASVQRHETDLARQREQVVRIETERDNELTEHNRLRGTSTARDQRLAQLTDQLDEREQALAQTRQANDELDAMMQQRALELADLRGRLNGLLLAGGRLATELGVSIPEGSEQIPESGVAMLELMLERARRALIDTAAERDELTRWVEARGVEVQAAAAREQQLAATVADLESQLARLRAAGQEHAEAVKQLLDERRVMVRLARAVVDSRAWRYGHRASAALRRMAFRAPRNADRGAAEVLLGMLETPPQLPDSDSDAVTR